MATVTNVEDRRAEVRFTEVADPYNPPVPGDVIYNPLYDPSGERTAVLAGRFSGQFNEAELKVLLSQMGITVQDKLTLDTDYLIVGSELYHGPRDRRAARRAAAGVRPADLQGRRVEGREHRLDQGSAHVLPGALAPTFIASESLLSLRKQSRACEHSARAPALLWATARAMAHAPSRTYPAGDERLDPSFHQRARTARRARRERAPPRGRGRDR
jgi:hypothetical protein